MLMHVACCTEQTHGVLHTVACRSAVFLSSMVAQWLASQLEGVGSSSWLGGFVLLPVLVLVSFGSSNPSKAPTEAGVGPQVLHSGCLLLLRDGLNAENRFHYIALSLSVCNNKEI